MRNKFSFYASYLEAIDSLPDEMQLQLYKAITHYALHSTEPEELTGFAKACFALIRPNIDSDNRRYDASVRNGNQGGRPNEIEIKPGNNLDKTQEEPKHNLDITQDKPKQNPAITQTKPKADPKQKPKTNPPIDNGKRITEKENGSFPPDNKNKNIFYHSTSAGKRPKEWSSADRERFLSPSYEYHSGDAFGTAMLEIADTLLEIEEYAQLQGTIKYQSKAYTASQIEDFLAKKGRVLVDELAYKIANDTTIKNKAQYILGSLLTGPEN